jgi:hypothetical protein
MIVMQEAHPWVRFFKTYRESRVGMDVARFQVAFGSWVQNVFQVFGTVSRRRFRHAVDNSGYSVGLVVDWLAFECWWQPYPPAARGSCGCADY